MEDSIEKLPTGQLKISSPFTNRIYKQQSNAGQARQVQLRVEQTLEKKKISAEYHKEMEKAIEAKSIVKLTEQELKDWTGPVHFITHFPVVNNESSSTKVRVILTVKCPTYTPSSVLMT